ncbi:MAG: tyrosine-type recombinase/integrase [Candidatus Aenigmarchaeota archaeon]|nr:tyrosine-type recombinase/integrase [Candidatus Aenigmarchaeota archaeon]
MNNKAFIDKFLEFMKAKGISKSRILKYHYTLPKVSEWLNRPFDKANKNDMIRLMAKIESNEQFADWTKNTYRAVIKRFFKWINGDEEYPDCVKWIKVGIKNNSKLPEDLLTVEDVLKLTDTATNIRDKALIICLYSSGCRISEILNVKIKELQFDEYSPIIIVSGKTGSRRIRVIDKQGLLKTWMNAHPFKDNPNEYVFISMATNRKENKPIEYRAVVKILKELANKSGIKKKVNPHQFRHSRATHLANKLTEAQMKQMFGWTQASKMASVYVHLSGRDLDEPLLRMSGLLDKEEEEKNNIISEFDRLLETDPKFRLDIARLLHDKGVKIK